MDRLFVTAARIRLRAGRRRRTGLAWLRRAAARRPDDVELRLLLAERELAAGHLDRAIDAAGIAIQLAPHDGRGLDLLRAAQGVDAAVAG